MENIALPSKIEIASGKKENEALISIAPCHPGYGITLGNALRRVLLSSLPGAAVTAIKVKGMSHEFSAMPSVKEDGVEILQNLKQLRMRVFSTEPVRLKLKAKGEKLVTAKDIEPNSDVEIVNKDLTICTLTSKDAEMEMELIVNQGRGYVPTESREKEDIEVDMIMLDSIFTPVKNVGLQIENVRVGQMTNYENLILAIETDGTASPDEALRQATKILIDHFNFIDQYFAGGNLPEAAESVVAEEEAEVALEEDAKEKKAKKTAKKKS